MPESIHITGDGNAIGNNNTISVNKTAISSGATLADFTALLGQMRTTIEAGELDAKTSRIIASDLAIVEGEVAENEPDKSIVEAKLASIASMAENASKIATSGSTLLPLILKAKEMVGGLFG